MPQKRGRPISTESTNAVAQQDREFERERKRRYRLKRLQQNTEQAIMQNEHLDTIYEATIEDQDTAATLVQLGLRVQGLTLPQDPSQITALQQAVDSGSYDQQQQPPHSSQPVTSSLQEIFQPRQDPFPVATITRRRPVPTQSHQTPPLSLQEIFQPRQDPFPIATITRRRPLPTQSHRTPPPLPLGQPSRPIEGRQSSLPIPLRQDPLSLPLTAPLLGPSRQRLSTLPRNQATVKQFFRTQPPKTPFSSQRQASDIAIGEPNPLGSNDRNSELLVIHQDIEEEANITRGRLR